MPRVLLRDTDPGAEPPLVRPTDRADADPTVRYRIDGEIARGGMGAILKGRDPDLGRDVAVKVLREDLRDRPEMVRRFVEEAQIGGQLQHPGIVPVYELGTFSDRRPFFSMKLVKGRTLAELLAARPSPADGLSRFLGIFEQVAQTVAYAHARGVIHRDLKPSNVMVGSFGEVQVMDWGLAKVLPRGGVIDDANAGKAPDQETLIATARSGGESDSDLSRAGSIMGTPSYMAPEQARGEVDAIDERADVFALGSMLCEVLTGSPAFTGRNSGEIQRKAARGDTADALARLDGCGADAELAALGRDCLAAEPMDRPRDAGAVRERITAHLAGVQERLRAAEIDRALRRGQGRRGAATATAPARPGRVAPGADDPRRPCLHLRAAPAAGPPARADRLLAEAILLRDQARERPDEVDRWERAREAVDRIAEDLGPSAPGSLAALRREVEAGREAAAADRDLLARLVDIRSAMADDPDGSATDAAYAEAFAAAGIDPDRGDPAEAGAGSPAARRRRPRPWPRRWITGPPSAASSTSGGRAGSGSWPPPAPPTPTRTATPSARPCSSRTRRSGCAGCGRWPSGPTPCRGRRPAWSCWAGPWPARATWTRGSRCCGGPRSRTRTTRGPIALGRLLLSLNPPQKEEAIRAFSIARALQPELSAHELAHLLERSDRIGEAEAVWLDLICRRPRETRHLGCYVTHLTLWPPVAGASAERDRAIDVLREEIRRRTDDPWLLIALYKTLGVEGRLDDEAAAWREAIRQRPDDAWAHANLGEVLKAQGRPDAGSPSSARRPGSSPICSSRTSNSAVVAGI